MEIDLTPPVQTEAVFWDVVLDALRQRGRELDDQARTRNSLSFRQICANFEWVEAEARRRQEAAQKHAHD